MTAAEAKKIPFQKLTAQETAELLEEMIKAPPEIVASEPQGRPINLRIRNVETVSPAKAYIEPNAQIDPKSQISYLLNFGMDSGVYFLKTGANKNFRGIYFDLSGEIFKFQRRDNFRCPVPDSVAASVTVFPSMDGEPLTGDIRLRNISGQGVGLNLPQDADLKIWKVSAELYLNLKILDLSLMGVRAIVRHVHPGVDFWVGLELPNITFAQETELSSTSLQLQRILFLAHSAR